MQIRYPNISFLFSPSQAVFSSGEARDDRCFTCLYSAITSFLHHEYSIHSHVGMHILYAARFMCSERFIFHSLAEHSGFLFAGSMLAACYCCCDCFSSFLWFRLVRKTVDRLFHTTLITSSCVLIWALLMSNHFNKNVISRGSWELKARENKILLLFRSFSFFFRCISSIWLRGGLLKPRKLLMR